MAKVSLQKVTRQFDNVTAVRDISFDVPDGEFWVLVGASGCGKSTLLRTVAGLESITSGELYIGDRLVNRVPARQRDVAMVFQNYALYPHMNVAENLAFGLRMRHQEPKYITQKVREVARSLDIEHLLKRKPKQLSGGQQQRVALGRAIARQPQVFLLDEPLSNLDDRLRTDMRGELQRIHQQFGITTIYVTHDRVEAMTLADKIVVLSNGEVQQIGSPQAVYANPINRTVAEFVGNPAMNILPVTYDGSQLILLDRQSISLEGASARKLELATGRYDVGIRPEHIVLSEETKDWHLQLHIDLIEPLGRETIVRATDAEGNYSINTIADGQWRGQKGDLLAVQFDLSKLFIFDPLTGKNLNH